MNIQLQEGTLQIHFRINEDKTVELVNFSALPDSADLPYQAARQESGFFAPFKPRQFLAAQVTGECAGGFHAGKHDVGSVSAEWRYVSQTLLEAEFKLKAESRMLLGKLTSVKAAIENGRVTLSYEGSFSFVESGLLGMITGPEKTFCREVSMKKSRGPEEIVRLMKGIIWRE